ncbi:histidine kinase [Actinoplanes sp. NPDC024001]|uniref:sensor histidine kinase n=1 Tax=Actinoplanes sp. NPDC024001 TaxID=3154598 RepID=UPI0033E78152
MTRHVLALARCTALALLAVAGFGYGLLVVAAATVVLPFPRAVAGQFRLVALGRRLARTWAGADLPDIERGPPPVPQRRPDGWYVHGTTLFKSPVVPRWLARADHYGEDPEAAREWYWLVAAPFTSALPILGTPLLIVTGLLVPLLQPWVSVAATAAAVLVAPLALRWYGRLTQARLRPADRKPSAPWRWISRAFALTWHAAGLAGISLAVFGATLLSLVALVLSLGGLLLPITTVLRPLVELYRRFAREWTGADLPSPYRPLPPPPVADQDGTYRYGRTLYDNRKDLEFARRYGSVARDPATWRDQLWSLGALPLGPVSLLPAAVVSLGFFGLVWQPLTWVIWAVPLGLATGYWVTPFWLWYALELAGLVPASIPDWTSLLTGLAVTLLGLLLAVPVTRLRLWWDRALLRPTAASLLATRVAQLSTSRADAVDAQAAELRRIERDLHDGAQARLIAVGLGLGAVARLMETDPVRARQLLTQAQETSAAALDELRHLVRGIHPPVLAERGLGDAVRAVALDTPLPVTVHVDLPGRLDPPVESAVYFAACETLANAARVASHVAVELTHRDGRLRLVVTDDGPGGADPAGGTGLSGIRRRLTAFDGSLSLHSPPGGPTVVTMEVPCASSSPKTSTS